jgi:hypothetical protein
MLSKMPLALDDMVDYLAGEDKYWCSIVNHPKSWSEKKTRSASAKARHIGKRRRLAHYYDRSKDTNRRSESLNVFDLAAEDKDGDGDETDSTSADSETRADMEDDGDIIDLVTLSDEAHELSPTATTIAKAATVGYFSSNSGKAADNKRSGSERKRGCPVCGRSRLINKDCSLQVCKDCCIESTKQCKVPVHKREKLGAAKPYDQTSVTTSTSSRGGDSAILPGILDKVESAIREKRSVYISYSGGTGGDHPRRITPQTLTPGKEGQLVTSYCHLANATRHFYLHKIKRIEDHDWIAFTLQTQGILRLMFFPC